MNKKIISILTLSIIAGTILFGELEIAQASEVKTASINPSIQISQSKHIDVNKPKSVVLKGYSDTSKPTLHPGDTGSYVKAMQNMLNYLSSVSDHPHHALWNCGSADGTFGSKTKAALIQYQKDANLTADGVCGPRTWGALESDCAYWE